MAVHADFPGLTAQIFVDGKPLMEYTNEEEEEEPKTTTRYVECRSGAEFEIKTSFALSFAPMDMSIHANLDGIDSNSLIAKRQKMLGKTCTKSGIEWKEGGAWRASKFLFSDLSVVADGSETNFEECLKTLSSVGVISVILRRILSYQRNTRSKGEKSELRETGQVSEEAIKGDVHSHVTKLTPEQAIKTPSKYSYKKAEEPLTIFRFKYRSKTALKSLGMLPRSPSPSPVPQPELVKKEERPEPTPEIRPNDVSPVATPRPTTPVAALVPLQRNSAASKPREQSGLTKKDMLILIKHYRGGSEGLEGLPEKELAILLSSYRPGGTPIKQEPAILDNRVSIKREPVEDNVARGRGKKRKIKVIVLDD